MWLELGKYTRHVHNHHRILIGRHDMYDPLKCACLDFLIHEHILIYLVEGKQQ